MPRLACSCETAAAVLEPRSFVARAAPGGRRLGAPRAPAASCSMTGPAGATLSSSVTPFTLEFLALWICTAQEKHRARAWHQTTLNRV